MDIKEDLGDFDKALSLFEWHCRQTILTMRDRFGYAPDDMNMLDLLRSKVNTAAVSIYIEQQDKGTIKCR